MDLSSGLKMAMGGKITVAIQRDGMRACVSIPLTQPGQDKEKFVAAIHAVIKDTGVTKGIDETAIRLIAEGAASKGEPVHDMVVAVGQPPVNGVDTRLRFSFELSGMNPAAVDADRRAGRIDPATIVKPLVRPGTVLLEIDPAVEGTDGFTVTGTVLPAKLPVTSEIKAGSGVESVDGAKFIVAQDYVGYADFANGTVLVESPVAIAQDRMTAWLITHPCAPPANPLSRGEVDHWLKSLGITHGVDTDRIDAALNAIATLQAPCSDTVIARGTPPAPGDDARLETPFHQAPVVGEEDEAHLHVDYRERQFLQKAKKGDLILRRIPATLGLPGCDVFGEEVAPRPGREIKLETSGKAELTKDGLEIRAAEDGVVVLTNPWSAGVFQEFDVPGDVDYHTGNLHMEGVLTVRGWIRAGFHVETKSDLYVGGGIEAANVESGGNISVVGGVVGSEDVCAQCSGSLSAQFLENARVQAAGDVVVRDAIMNSEVTTEGRVLVSGGKGRIIGGRTCAARGVRVKELGSHVGLRTVIEAGLDSNTRKQLGHLTKACSLYERNRGKISRTLAEFLVKTQNRRVTFNEIHAMRKLAHYRREMELKHRKLVKLREQLADSTVTVRVDRAVYEGTIVWLLGRRMNVEETIEKPGTFMYDSATDSVIYKT